LYDFDVKQSLTKQQQKHSLMMIMDWCGFVCFYLYWYI